MTQLYVLAQQYSQQVAILADMDLDAQTIADTLESLSGDLETKATNVAMFARNLEATAEQIKAAESQMATRRKAMEARADSLRRYLLAAMQQTGIQKIESPHLRLSVRDNPPAVDVFDLAQVPAEFMAAPPPPPAPAPDKAAMKAAFKAGRDVAGCRITQAQRLEIK